MEVEEVASERRWKVGDVCKQAEASSIDKSNERNELGSMLSFLFPVTSSGGVISDVHSQFSILRRHQNWLPKADISDRQISFQFVAF